MTSNVEKADQISTPTKENQADLVQNSPAEQQQLSNDKLTAVNKAQTESNTPIKVIEQELEDKKESQANGTPQKEQSLNGKHEQTKAQPEADVEAGQQILSEEFLEEEEELGIKVLQGPPLPDDEDEEDWEEEEADSDESDEQAYLDDEDDEDYEEEGDEGEEGVAGPSSSKKRKFEEVDVAGPSSSRQRGKRARASEDSDEDEYQQD
eukprot:TRINITY_DN121_c1_g2_i1.p2 TRINITY_DN121_c1_g2~~TRINITY_DN121_c1_g2_i1.p2  ORF type:complete len:227 (-),score=64.54 TRINITY_DN121_c1_g2_i1:314-937(-)